MRKNERAHITRHWFDFVRALSEKEIKTRYKTASLGFLWMVINPVLQMLVIGVIFQFFMPVPVPNYFAFLFAGLLPWNFFSYSLTKTTPSIVFERTLIQKAKFPREAIVLSIIASNLFHLLVSLVLFVGTLMLLALWQANQGELLRVVAYTPYLILATAWLSILCVGFSLIFSSLNVRFRDMNFIVQALIPLWFYATPIVYRLDLLPSHLRAVMYMNPLTAITELFQWALVGLEPFSLMQWIYSVLGTFAVLLIGVYIFRKESPYFDDWL